MKQDDLMPEDRTALLRIARRAISSRLQGEAPPPEAVSAALKTPCSAFVTLSRRDSRELRGCIGYMDAVYPLAEAVEHAAVAAASRDDRFDPVRLEELSSLVVTISVLSATRRIRPQEVEVGTHGLIVRFGGRCGLLLPQVAIEHGWGRETFLDQTCRKAGLHVEAWRDPAAEILAFTAIVFAEAGSVA